MDNEHNRLMLWNFLVIIKIQILAELLYMQLIYYHFDRGCVNQWTTAYTKLSTTEFVDIFIKGKRKALSYGKCQKIEVWRKLGCVKSKRLFTQTILDKIFGAKWRNPVNLDRAKKLWYLVLSNSWLLLPIPNL